MTASETPPRARRKANSDVDATSKPKKSARKKATKKAGAAAPAAKATAGAKPKKSAARGPRKGPSGRAKKKPSKAEPKRAKEVASSAGKAAARKTTSKAKASKNAATDEGAVLVTGICGRLGQLLVRRLHRSERVVGVDRRPFPHRPRDIVFHQLDLRRKRTRDLFRKGNIRAVVHLGVLHDLRASDKEHHAWNVVAFQKLLGYLSQYQVPKLVVLSSANVYGPVSDNPQFLSEEAPLLGAQSFRGIRDLVELDMLAQSFFWRHPDAETVILRPCHILGRVRNAPSNYLRLPRPVTMLGFDPMVQPIHEADVVHAIQLALKPGVRGIFNVRGPGEAPLSRVLGMLGRKPRPVPGFAAKPILSRMWRYRLTSFPAPELDYVRFQCMVDGKRAEETLGFSPRFNFQETLSAVDAER